jgi:CRISPR-associated Csx2 family protein
MEDDGMARVYLSFLGTNDYLDCHYFNDGFETPGPVRFVQEASIIDNCKDWGPADRIIMLTTHDADLKNWRDDGHIDLHTSERLERKGLQSCLRDLRLKAPIIQEPIPEGHDEEQLWAIFETVSQCFQEEDEVVFDITHAFRSIPLIAIVVLNYVKVLRQARLKRIVYGAFEALGSYQEVKAMPVEERRVRLLDLTPLDHLMDWTIATDRFLATGDASMAGALAREGALGILRESRGADEAAQAINRLGAAMVSFSTLIFTCRGPEIGARSAQLKECLQGAREIDLPRPFRPLFGKLEQRLEAFGGSAVQDGLAAVRWCLDHNLVQQGYTILEEVLFGHVVEQAGGEVQNVSHRMAASQAFTVVSRKWVDDPCKWGDEGRKDPALTRKMIDCILAHGELHRTVERIRDRRNDLNHAGFTDNGLRVDRARRFSEDLQECLIGVETVLLGPPRRA